MGFHRNDRDYTLRARRFVSKFPLLNNVMVQINFWVWAFVLLIIIIHFANNALLHSLSLSRNIRLGPNVVMAIVIGIIYGSALGLLDYFFDRNFFRNKPLGKVIAFKSLLSLLLLLLAFGLVRYFLFDLIVLSSIGKDIPPVNNEVWEQFLYLVLIYCFFMTLVINFVIQVNKKFGPGVLLPLLLGKYRDPREEERAFLFMDLKSSTTIAEALGHLQYSAFIRDSFIDINSVLQEHDAEVYQYVGDEIVLSWRVSEDLKKIGCVYFFFACQKQFELRSEYYLEKYGFLPSFKAGLHIGKVTAVEIGETKRDIAYHGDTLNTAARIQSMCNHYGKKFLVSAHFFEKCDLGDYFRTEMLGDIMLKGKTLPVGILSVEEQG